MRARENPARKTFAFANQAQQQMLGLDRCATQLRGLIACKKEDTPRTFCVPFKHLVVRLEATPTSALSAL